MCEDSKRTKRQSRHQCLFALLGSLQAKAAHKTLGKLTPQVNFTTIYEQLLCMKVPKAQRDTDDLTVFFALSGSAHVKAVHKTLGKLTPRVNFNSNL